MASIYRRGSTWWIKYKVAGQVVRESTGTDNKKVAEAHRKRIEYLRITNRLGLPSRTSVSELLTEYYAHMRAHRKHKSAESDINRLTKFFDAVRVPVLEDLTPAIVQQYLDGRILDGEIKQKTANEYRVVLHTLFEYAIAYKGYVSTDRQYPNPIKRVKRFRVSHQEPRFLTLKQIDEQLAALKPRLDDDEEDEREPQTPEQQQRYAQLHAMVATYIYAGLRRAEATWLTVDDVKLRSSPPMIHIRAKEIDGEAWEPKTKQPRRVPISRALRPILAEWLLRRPTVSVGACPGVAPNEVRTEAGWFFPSPQGRRWDEDNFSSDFRRVQKKAKLAWSCLDFRHTFGSQLAQKGESLYMISKLMGNSPEVCRKHYAALVPEEMGEVVEFGVLDCRTPAHSPSRPRLNGAKEMKRRADPSA